MDPHGEIKFWWLMAGQAAFYCTMCVHFLFFSFQISKTQCTLFGHLHPTGAIKLKRIEYAWWLDHVPTANEAL